MNKATATYYCPMHPEIISKSSGDCPICGMMLEPLLSRKISSDVSLKDLKRRVIIASFLTLPVIFLHMFPLGIEEFISIQGLLLIEFLITTLIVWVAGWPTVLKGIKSFLTLQLNMYSLISLGVLTSYFYSLGKMIAPYFSHEPFSEGLLKGLFFESSAVITTFVLIGAYLEAKAARKTGEQIESLMALSPQVTHLILSAQEERKIAIEDVQKGDLLRVKPGEKVPVDGVIKDGQSWINEAMITGEVIPVLKKPGFDVLAGTLNGNSSFTMIAKKVGEETVLAEIIQLTDTARLSKAPIQKLADKIAAYFVPLVLLIAFSTGIGWYLSGYSLSTAITHAISVLIIACPCALGLATPMSMAVGIGLGASQGILIRDAEALEQMEKVTTLLIDKTGTLTEGKPMLTKIFAKFPFSEAEVLKFASSIEQFSQHPIAEAIVACAKLKQIPFLNPLHFQNIEGKGVIAEIDGSRVVLGNAQLLSDLSIDSYSLLPQGLQWQKEGLTVSFLALESRLIGLLGVSDSIKFTAERAIQQLHREGIRIIMATGDSREAALTVAKKLQIDEIYADAPPQHKMAFVQALQAQGFIVAMAGDGVNDAPALAQANVGISISTGSDAAIYNSGITLIKGDLCGVVRARILSAMTMKNVRQNLFFAFIYNIIAIPFAAGLFSYFIPVTLTPIIASIAMTLSSLCVIGNALRLRGRVLYD